jgi:hypothetical protein
VALNNIQDAVLDARLNANGLEAMAPPMAQRVAEHASCWRDMSAKHLQD